MEDIKINLEKDLNNIKGISQFKSNKMYYNCTECQSAIEIIKIQEKFIEFQCNNDHNIKMEIKDYLERIKEYRNKINLNDEIITNDSICNKHKKNINHIVLIVISIYVKNVKNQVNIVFILK